MTNAKTNKKIKYSNNEIIFNRYQIIREIGTGGMNSVVYEGINLDIDPKNSIDNRIAIKVVSKSDEISNDEWLKFLDECRTSFRVSNKSYLVKTYDVVKSDDDSTVWIIMEYVEGFSLRYYIDKSGLIPVKEAASIFLKILRGVQNLHSFQQQIIHRDLKPENILLTKDLTEIKIIDFGIASVVDYQVLNSKNYSRILTNEKAIYGTYPYICPDIFQIVRPNADISKIITTQFDFFSLGVIFFEMLTGQKPFQYDDYHNVNVIKLPLTYDFNLLSDMAPGIPNKIENIIFKCLASKPSDLKFRYQNISEIILDLSEYLEHPELANNVALLKPANERTYQSLNLIDPQNMMSKKFYHQTWFYYLTSVILIALLIIMVVVFEVLN